MAWYHGLLLGILQGLTEFLPVSSSGHLALAEHLLGLDMTAPLYFDILLHLGTLAAVFFVFWKDIAGMLLAVPEVFKSRPNPGRKAAGRLILLIAAGTLPLGLVLPFLGLAETLSSNIQVVGAALIVTGILLLVASRAGKSGKDERSARFSDALLVGAAQAVTAVIPGLSRSGTTLSVGLFAGFSRTFALRFTFLLSLPTVLGGCVVELVRALGSAAFDPGILPACVVGILTSALVGTIAVGLLRKLAERLHFFAAYCVVVGLVAVTVRFFT